MLAGDGVTHGDWLAVCYFQWHIGACPLCVLEKLMYEQVLENNGKLSNSSAEDDMNRVIREYNGIKH